MGKGFDFFREVVNGVVDEMALNYGVCKAKDILLELNIDDEKIKQILVKHFDIKYSEAENVLAEVKECRNNQ